MAATRLPVRDATVSATVVAQGWAQTDTSAVALLQTVVLHDSTLPTKLRRLLAEKDLVHYPPNLITVASARSMIRNARALLNEAERL